MGSPWNFQFAHFAGLFSKGKQQLCAEMCKTDAHVEWLSLRMRWNFFSKKMPFAQAAIEFYLPGVHFSKRPVTFRARRQILKSKPI